MTRVCEGGGGGGCYKGLRGWGGDKGLPGRGGGGCRGRGNRHTAGAEKAITLQGCLRGQPVRRYRLVSRRTSVRFLFGISFFCFKKRGGGGREKSGLWTLSL